MAGGIPSLESIPGLHKRLKLRALSIPELPRAFLPYTTLARREKMQVTALPSKILSYSKKQKTGRQKVMCTDAFVHVFTILRQKCLQGGGGQVDRRAKKCFTKLERLFVL
jgi:hypothetical protein